MTKPAHILRLPLISDVGLQGWPDWFRAADVRRANLPASHSFTDSTDAMLAAVYGLGVALARRHIAAPYLERGELIQLPGPTLKARFSYYVVHPAHRRPSAAAATFIASNACAFEIAAATFFRFRTMPGTASNRTTSSGPYAAMR